MTVKREAANARLIVPPRQFDGFTRKPRKRKQDLDPWAGAPAISHKPSLIFLTNPQIRDSRGGRERPLRRQTAYERAVERCHDPISDDSRVTTSGKSSPDPFQMSQTGCPPQRPPPCASVGGKGPNSSLAPDSSPSSFRAPSRGTSPDAPLLPFPTRRPPTRWLSAVRRNLSPAWCGDRLPFVCANGPRTITSLTLFTLSPPLATPRSASISTVARAITRVRARTASGCPLPQG